MIGTLEGGKEVDWELEKMTECHKHDIVDDYLEDVSMNTE
jgi:hypothetical protein